MSDEKVARAVSGKVLAAMVTVIVQEDDGTIHVKVLSRGGIKSEDLPHAEGTFHFTQYIDPSIAGAYKPPDEKWLSTMRAALSGKIEIKAVEE